MSAEDQDTRNVILEICREMGLDRSDAEVIESMLPRPESAWPICCGSGCQPCADDLSAAALRVKARLGLK